jgi:endonuclease-8
VPEGDTIWRAAATLRAALQGRRLTIAKPDRLKRLAGAMVVDVKAVGKHLIIRFDNGLAVHSHMRMQGAWHVYRKGERWRRPEWQAKALLETEDSVAVCFSPPVVDLIRDEEPKVGHLGPDILRDDWKVEEVVANARRTDGKAIGEVMLDQRVTAGIGNVYRCEALWHERVNPWSGERELTDEQLKALFETAREAMLANLGQDFKRRFPGYGRGAVHGRAGRPCPRCGTRIEFRAQGEHARMTYWCPACQRRPER